MPRYTTIGILGIFAETVQVFNMEKFSRDRNEHLRDVAKGMYPGLELVTAREDEVQGVLRNFLNRSV